jgi:choline dehydrogenase-like flavoprotein
VDGAGRVSGVTWVDRATGDVHSAHAPIVFACASAFETTRILLSSRSAKSPDGIGASSGALGRFVMDHITMSAEGEGGALLNKEELIPGRCVFVEGMTVAAGTLQGIQIYRWSRGDARSNFNAVSFAEMTPRAGNRVVLNDDVKDACGNPTLRIECRHNDADVAMATEQSRAIRDVADALGVRLTRHDTRPPPPGTAMHECGGARMGISPETSVLDPNNECWEAKGLYVTDGAAFPTQGIQHPTLTIMAMTARACAHAVRMLPLAAASLMHSQFLAPLGA